MSVDENEVEADLSIEDIIYEAYAESDNGETVVEEPENSAQPEVEVEAQENQDSVESEPEAPVVSDVISESQVEGQEESTLPEWSKELDLSDQNVADAVEFFAGGEKAEWTRKSHKEMEEGQLVYICVCLWKACVLGVSVL